MSNKLFREWVESLPDDTWAKKDLSACRLGWDAAVDRAMGIVRNRDTQGEALDELNAMLQEGDPDEIIIHTNPGLNDYKLSKKTDTKVSTKVSNSEEHF